MEKVELDGKVLLGLFNQPLEFEFGKQPAHDFHTILHRVHVDFRIPANVVMLDFNGDFFTILQGRAMDLGQTCNAEWLRLERRE